MNRELSCIREHILLLTVKTYKSVNIFWLQEGSTGRTRSLKG